MPRYFPIRYTQPPPTFATLAVAEALHAHAAESSPVAGGGSAAGVTGSISADGSITIASDGSNNFGSQGPSVFLFDDGRNYGSAGSAVANSAPTVGSYVSGQVEGISHAGGRNQTNGRGMLMSYITSAERNGNGGGRQNSVYFGSAQTEIYLWRSVKWAQKGTYSGSFFKTAWVFDSVTPGAGGVWDIVLGTFTSGQDFFSFSGNNNGGTSDDGEMVGFGLTSKADTSGGWNVWESWLKLGASSVSGDTCQFRSTNGVSNYDSGVDTKFVSQSGTRQFQSMTILGWHGDAGGDSRITGNNEIVHGDTYIALGAGAAARVMIGNSPTLSACTDLSICTPTSWSNTSISATVRSCGFSEFAGKYLFVVDADGDVVPYSGSEGRLIS